MSSERTAGADVANGGLLPRRAFLRAAAGGCVAAFAPLAVGPAHASGVSVETLPALEGELTLYLGRGEGGLYENVLGAIEARNPGLELNVRRGPTAALANAIVAEARAGIRRADLFWAVDSGAVGFVDDAGLARALPADLTSKLAPQYRYERFAPITGRVRTVAYNAERVAPQALGTSIMALPESGLRIGWAPAYASFQSFVTAMRLLEGEERTADWLRRTAKHARSYAGELGVVMGVDRGEVDVGFANHYYALRLRSGRPEARVALAYTQGDAGCLVNASGIVALDERELATNFVRYLLTREVQGYLAREAYELPLVEGIAGPPELPSLATLTPPAVDLRSLGDLQPTLELMRDVGVL